MWQLRELQASAEMADRIQVGTLQGLCLYTELTLVSFSEGRELNTALCGEKQKRHILPFLFRPGHVQHATLFLSSSNPLVSCPVTDWHCCVLLPSALRAARLWPGHTELQE